MITASTSLSGNKARKSSNNSIRDFKKFKRFNANIHHPRAPIIKEVIWNHVTSSCGGIFRNHEFEFMIFFAEYLGLSSYQAKLCGAMGAIELAYQ